MKGSLNIQWWWHVLLIGTFLMLPFLMGPHPFEEGRPWFTHGTLREMFIHGFLVLFFYLHYYFLLPRLFFPRKYIAYGISLVTGFALVILLPDLLRAVDLIHPHAHPSVQGRPPMKPWLITEMARHFFLFLTVILLGLFIKLNERLRITRHEKTQAELSYLKAQVNPHFLFNTLNTIYSLALVKSERTPDAVVHLSGMMRYVLTDSQDEFVALDKEIEYIRNYVLLQKLRLDDSVQLSFEVTGETRGLQIAPLLLIPFIENAFKYGVNPEENSEITVNLVMEAERLDMTVSNSIVHVTIPEEDRTGLGIRNAREQMALLYPGRHELSIHHDRHRHEVRLKLSLS